MVEQTNVEYYPTKQQDGVFEGAGALRNHDHQKHMGRQAAVRPY